MNHGRTFGIILIVIAILISLASVALLGTQFVTEETASAGGQVLGFVLVFICAVLPIAAVGVYLFIRGQAEEKKMAKARQERTILNMVLAQGKVTFNDISLELGISRDETEDLVRELIGMQLFTGAVNWNDGILYSEEASQLKADRRCPNCGGELELAGKGVIECPWCGSEIFLHLD